MKPLSPPERPGSGMNSDGMCCLPECIRPVPSLQSLEAPADSASASEIPAIWFYSVKMDLSCHLSAVNLYGLLKDATCQMAALGRAFS